MSEKNGNLLKGLLVGGLIGTALLGILFALSDPQGRPQVIGKDQEGRSVRYYPAVQCQAINHCAHCMLSDAEVNVSPPGAFKCMVR